MIQPGQTIDLATPLRIVRAGAEETVTLGELLAPRPAIVSVYMRNNTPGCDRQIDSLVAHAAEFERLGYTLVALSRDTCGSHRKYAVKKSVPFVLASDPDDAFARAVDAIVEKTMYGRTYEGPARSAFVLARDGRVLAVVPKVDTKDHAAQLRAVLAELPA
ncbi:MAG: redoxin domain-containing protein [Verrucomicrobiota bacterium]